MFRVRKTLTTRIIKASKSHVVFRQFSTENLSKAAGGTYYDGKTMTPGAQRFSKSVQVERIHFLGTSSATPTTYCNVSSCVFMLNNSKTIMFDCGEATQHQAIRSSRFTLNDLSAICITHLHGDHFYGIFGILAALNSIERTEPLYIVGPPGIRTAINTILRHSSCYLSYPRVIVEVPTNTMTEITEFKDAFGISLKSVPLLHKVPTVGYVIEEPATKPKLDALKLVSLGASYKDIRTVKYGGTFTTPDNQVITLADVTSPSKPGRKFSFLQDTRDSSKARPYIDDSFVMIHEATHDASQYDLSYRSFHSTTHDAAKTAVDSRAKNLIMTHFSPRYTREPIEVVHAPIPLDPFRLLAQYTSPYNMDLMAHVVDHYVAPPELVLCRSCGEKMNPISIESKYVHLYSSWASQRASKKKIAGDSQAESELKTAVEPTQASCQHETVEQISFTEQEASDFHKKFTSFSSVVHEINVSNEQKSEEAMKKPVSCEPCCDHNHEHNHHDQTEPLEQFPAKQPEPLQVSQRTYKLGDVELNEYELEKLEQLEPESPEQPNDSEQFNSSQTSKPNYYTTVHGMKFVDSLEAFEKLETDEPIAYLNSRSRTSLKKFTVLDLLEEAKEHATKLLEEKNGKKNEPEQTLEIFNAADYRTFVVTGDKVQQDLYADIQISRY